MTLDPARPEKTRRGVWGGVAPPVGLGFGIPSAARVRVWVRPHYPELPVPGPRRDMGWVWVWVIFPGFWRTLQTQISNISRILKNVADSDFQYFQDPGECCRLGFPIFQDPGTLEKKDFQYFQDPRTPEKSDFQYVQEPKDRFPIFPGF